MTNEQYRAAEEEYLYQENQGKESKGIEESLKIQKEENKMNREKMIGEMKGNYITVDAEWLKENDPEMLDWITLSKYWGRGYKKEIPEDEAIVEFYFTENGVSYTATFESNPNGIRQSINNQPPWGEDAWDDWDAELIKTYYEKLQEVK